VGLPRFRSKGACGDIYRGGILVICNPVFAAEVKALAFSLFYRRSDNCRENPLFTTNLRVRSVVIILSSAILQVLIRRNPESISADGGHITANSAADCQWGRECGVHVLPVRDVVRLDTGANWIPGMADRFRAEIAAALVVLTVQPPLMKL
jgi:hypothetical protein